MFITHLSGSEAERQSQSSANESDEDDSMSDGDASSTTDNELDEFGFPRPTATTETNEDAPLVLMENWDGQFVLVQPRQEKENSRSRDRSRRRDGGSRRDSIGGSTAGSTLADNGGLIIDPDANLGEFSSDTDSMWSGYSDEDENGGDTTDSMEEDDMPMLDSPALQQLIDDQMGGIQGLNTNSGTSIGLAVNGVSSSVEVGGHGAPAIVITDVTNTSTPALSTDPSSAPTLPTTPAAPQMGTFHPTTDHPAQHAVIDGSKVPTKSPFTHRRRTRLTRELSTPSTLQSETVRKRKSSLSSSINQAPYTNHIPITPFDPFSATPTTSTLPKRARYSSIPGHPRYLKAKKQAQMMNDDSDYESESDIRGDIEEEEIDEEGGIAEIDLEDMLETSLLAHGTVDDDDGTSGEDGFRFDRVPVSTYLRRHFRSNGGSALESHQYQSSQQSFSSPLHMMRRGRHGAGEYAASGNGIQDTLVGGMIWGNGVDANQGGGGGQGGMTLTMGMQLGIGMISPFLAPVVEEQSQSVMSRREKRRGRKRGVREELDLGMGVPGLSI
jgi:hypothetical protein